MKTQLRNIIFTCFIGGVVSACDMEVIPPAEISAENFWKTEQDAWFALNGCYQSMPALDIWDEMCTDNAHSHKPWEGNFELVQQNGINPGNSYGNYSFGPIRSANTFLAHVDECDMSEERKTRMKAEARFFRAFSFLDLHLYYGKVPLVKDELAYDAPTVARNSVEEVRSFILKELQDISEILPESYSGGFNNETGRITKYAALALRARAALYFGDYIEAEKSAKVVIESKKYSLFKISELSAAQQQEANEMDVYLDEDVLEAAGTNKDRFIKGMFSYESLWQGSNATPSNPEYVLTHEYMEDVHAYDEYRYTYFLPLYMSANSGYSSFEPNQELVSAYWNIDGKTLPEITIDTRKNNYLNMWKEVKDLDAKSYKELVTSSDYAKYDFVKEYRNRDSRLYASILFPGKGWHETVAGEKYIKWDHTKIAHDGNDSWTGYTFRKMVSWNPYNNFFGSSDDYPTIRYAEVLLTYAEAHLMNSGYDAEVCGALNQLRDRCGMPNVPTGLLKQEAIDFVRNERRIELAGEGHRFNDVRRYGSDYCKKYLNGPLVAIDGTVLLTKKWDDRMMLMPIPTGAIDVNPLLKDDQNPGY